MDPIVIQDYCAATWAFLAKPLLAPSEDSRKAEEKFIKQCHARGMKEDEMKTPVGNVCFIQTSGDKFVPNPEAKKEGAEKYLFQPIEMAAACIVAYAKAEKWVAFKDATPVDTKPATDTPKSVGLPAGATPTHVDPPKAPTPTAVDLPAGATPTHVDPPKAPTPTAVDLPMDPSATAVGLSADATSTTAPASNFSWYNGFFGLFGGGILPQPAGLSVNGADPVEKIGSPVFSLRTGVLLTHVKLPRNFEYETAVFAQAGVTNPLDNKSATIYDVGGGLAFQFSYTLSSGVKLRLAPDVTLGDGVLWQNVPVNVGIPDKLYWAADSYHFPQMTGGMGVFFDIPTGHEKLAITVGAHMDYHWSWYKDAVTNLPAGMPADTKVSLPSGLGALQIYFGFRK